MYCKFCGAQLDENSTVCANCGQTNESEPQKKKVSAWKVAIAAVCVVVLVAALGAMVYYGLYGTLKPRENDVYYKDSYTVSDQKISSKLDKVIAKMGDTELTNRQLQVFYWMHIYNYGYYYDVDLDEPLHEQIMDEDTGMTWQQYFLECAMISWQQYSALTNMADEAGYTLPQEYQDVLDGLKASAEENAQSGGFASVQEMMEADFGPGVTLEDYTEFFRRYYVGNLYFSQLVEQQEITQEEMDTYFAENGSSLITSWSVAVTKDMGTLADVRHILIQPESTTDENGNEIYTDEAWEACLKETQAIYDEWVKGGADEETFCELAYEYSADGNYSDGGLYEDISKGIMVTEFEQWCLDESREYGDHGIVKTDFGYHIMFFVDGEDGYVRYCRDGVLSEKADQLLKEILEENTVDVNYKAIVLADVVLSSN